MRSRLFMAMLLMYLAGSFTAVDAQKIDTLVLKNGNIITGEIKRLELGMLSYKTDAAGTIDVKWEKIINIKSPRTFDIQTEDGGRYFGSLGMSDRENFVKINFINNFLELPLDKLVEIHPLKRTFWMRLDGSVDLGYSFTKASQVSQLNFGGNVTYYGEKWSSSISLNSIITTQPGKDQTRKQDLNISLTKFLRNQWNITTVAGAEQNTELGLQLRTLLALGVKNDLIHNKRNYLTAIAGLTVNREWSANYENSKNNLESFIGLQFNKFKHVSPKVDISSNVYVYPSISDWGRVRFNAEIKSRIEIVSDLFVGITVYDNFDSRPATEGSAKNDWGVISSVGYTF